MGTKSSPSAPRPCSQMMLCAGFGPLSSVILGRVSFICAFDADSDPAKRSVAMRTGNGGCSVRLGNELPEHLKDLAVVLGRAAGRASEPPDYAMQVRLVRE